MALGRYSHRQNRRTLEFVSSKLGCGYSDCAISTPTHTFGHSYKESLMKRDTSLLHVNEGISCDCQSQNVLHRFHLLIGLDSLGGVTCSRLTFDPTPLSCTAKVAASHISGVDLVLENSHL